MGWFGITTSKDSRESAYNGGEKHFRDVLENQVNDDNWMYVMDPRVDFNTGSTLFVRQGEIAILENNAELSSVFEPSRYTLTTENYPIISRFRNMLTGGISAYSCRIHYFRTGISKSIFWGVGDIRIYDSQNRYAKLGAAGTYRYKIDNPGVFIKNVVCRNEFVNQEKVLEYLETQIASIAKQHLSNYLKQHRDSLLEAVNEVIDIANYISPNLEDALDEFGLSLNNFVVEAVNFTNSYEEEYDKTSQSYFERERGLIAEDEQKIRRIISAQGDLGVMETLGDNWGRQQAADILKNISLNPGAGGVAAAGAGLGMGMGAGNVISSMASQVFAPFNTQQPQTPVQTNAPSRFQQARNIQEKPVAPPPPPMNSNKFYVYLNSQVCGPFDMQAIEQHVKNGIINPQTQVCLEGKAEWQLAAVTEISKLFNQNVGSMPPPPPMNPNSNF